jgi:hypothetical protein
LEEEDDLGTSHQEHLNILTYIYIYIYIYMSIRVSEYLYIYIYVEGDIDLCAQDVGAPQKSP